MKLKLITPPASEPVTLTETKSALSIDGTDRDTQVTAAISAARMLVEEFTNRALITQTLELALDAAPCEAVLELPRAPLASVTSVTWYSDADDATVFDAGAYHVDTYGEPGGIALAQGETWPLSGDMRTVNGIIVRYVAGYGTATTDVPRVLREAIIEQVRALIDGDEDAEKRAMRLARPFRIIPI